MGKYLITYIGGAQPDDMTEQQRNDVMQQWVDWYTGLGEAVVDAGNPTSASRVVGPGSGTVPDVTGYTVISADSLDAAAAACSKHPHLDAGGTIHVYETFEVM